MTVINAFDFSLAAWFVRVGRPILLRARPSSCDRLAARQSAVQHLRQRQLPGLHCILCRLWAVGSWPDVQVLQVAVRRLAD